MLKVSTDMARLWTRASVLALLAAFAGSTAVHANDADLAKKLSNPVASLISVPFQLNYDDGYGPADGNKWLLNIQPVIPFSISSDWNLITRVIVPVTGQDNVFGNSGYQSGLGDTTLSMFFSPKSPGPGGLTWGVGPAFLIPTATEKELGTGKWGIGPTAVVLKQNGGWTFGGLANHIWSVGGDGNRADVNSTFLQPFLSYTTPSALTLGVNTEASYNWNSEQWSVPVNFTVSKLTKFGNQPVSIGAGVRWWAQSAPGGPDGVGYRLLVTFLFPK